MPGEGFTAKNPFLPSLSMPKQCFTSPHSTVYCFAKQVPGYQTGTITGVILEQPPYLIMGFRGAPTLVSGQECAANSMTTPAGSSTDQGWHRQNLLYFMH